MVLKKRVDYGFNGFRVPIIPKAPRSVRVSTEYFLQLWQLFYVFHFLRIELYFDPFL